MSEVLTMPRAEELRDPAGRFVAFRSMTGPALVRLDRVVLVRPSPDGSERTPIALENGHEMVARQRAEEAFRPSPQQSSGVSSEKWNPVVCKIGATGGYLSITQS